MSCRRLLARTASVVLLACAGVALEASAAPPAFASNLWLQSCRYYHNPGSAFTGIKGGEGWAAPNACAQNDTFEINSAGSPADGTLSQWSTSTPTQITIDSAYTPPDQVLVDCTLGADGYQAYWQWGAQLQQIEPTSGCGLEHLAVGSGIDRSIAPTHSFRWFVKCVEAPGYCSKRNIKLLGVGGIQLGATETTSPAMAALGANNLYFELGRWVRGAWPISLEAADVSGVCEMRALVAGGVVQGPTVARDRSVWDQCDDRASYYGQPQLWEGGGASVNTYAYPTGASLSVAFQAQNAAGNWSTSPASTVLVDNSPVDLSLGGPTSAPTTAGTQYLAATATAGPSGVGAVYCSVDGGAWSAEPLAGVGAQVAEAEVPVSGLGSHAASCYAANRAVDSAGRPALSPMRTWSIRIGEPVRGAITFAKISRRCHRARRRVVVAPGRWVTVTRHHRRMRVHRPPRTRVERVLVCKAYTRARSVEHVRYGHRVTVSGWFATADGVPLSHVRVSIMATANNGFRAWRRVATARTSASGSWSVRLPPGPSRLIEAIYAGGPTTQPEISRIVGTVVSARVLLTSVPRHVRWGQLLRIRGRVLGGYIPPEQILRVIDGPAGDRHLHVIANPMLGRDGRFVMQLRASGSGGPLRLELAVGTLRETNYPYAPGISRRASITIG